MATVDCAILPKCLSLDFRKLVIAAIYGSVRSLTHSYAVIELISNREFLIAPGIVFDRKCRVVRADMCNVAVLPVAELWMSMVKVSNVLRPELSSRKVPIAWNCVLRNVS